MAILNYQSGGDRAREGGFLRSLFGPSKEEIWRQFAEQINAAYVSGGFWRGDKVVARTGEWTLTLDTYTDTDTDNNSTTYTRLRAPFVNRDGFYFRIYRASIFSPLGKLFGMQDIEIGDPFFDQDFIIKSNSEEKVRTLLADPAIRSLIAAQPRIYFQVKDDEGWFFQSFPQGVDELYFSAMGVIKDVAQLRGLFDLFALTLHRLCHIGSAYENDPGITL